jgi:hypothetical protein
VVYIVRLLTRPSPPIITASLRPPAISSFTLSSSFSSSAGYQKAFLLCTLLETALRSLYFMLWPFIGMSCQPSLTSFHFHWIDVSIPTTATATAPLSHAACCSYSPSAVLSLLCAGTGQPPALSVHARLLHPRLLIVSSGRTPHSGWTAGDTAHVGRLHCCCLSVVCLMSALASITSSCFTAASVRRCVCTSCSHCSAA